MTRLRRYGPWLVLAACIAAALVFRRFAYVAWYPVAMSAALAAGFALSLFGREPLCLACARRIPPGILPEGAEAYCRRYTAFWALWLTVNGLIAAATIYAPGPVWHLEQAGLDVPCAWVAWNCCLSYGATGLILLVEWCVRRRRFAVVFTTSGSTAAPKRIVKPFSTLAREVAFHRARLAPLLREKPVFLATIEPQHMYGRLWRVLLPQAAGCAVDPEIIRAPESLLAKMRAAPRVVLVTTPSFLDRFCAYADQYDVPRTCVEIVTSGALLSAATSAAAKRVFGIAPREVFGSTETGGVAERRQSETTDAYDWEVFAPVTVRATAAGCLEVDSPFSVQRRGYVMGDGVELAPDGRRFRLLGRRDRLVKIAEQRVSLPALEEACRATLPLVRDLALAPLLGARGPMLGALVVPDLAAVDPARGRRALARQLRAQFVPLFPSGAVPRRIRFTRALPRNAQGKVVQADVQTALETNLVEPFVLDEAYAENTWRATLVFDADAPYFQGHFPGFAVLPGVVQLGLARHFAAATVAPGAGAPTTVKKMKFTHVIVPGERVQLTLTRAADGAVAYDYRKGDLPCSSGVICF